MLTLIHELHRSDKLTTGVHDVIISEINVFSELLTIGFQPISQNENGYIKGRFYDLECIEPTILEFFNICNIEAVPKVYELIELYNLLGKKLQITIENTNKCGGHQLEVIKIENPFI